MKSILWISLVFAGFVRAQEADDEVDQEAEVTAESVRGGNPFQDMEIEERIKAVIEHFKNDDPKGIPGYPIPDPMDVPDASPDAGGTTMKLTESKLYGLSKLSVTYVRVDFVRMKFEIGLSFPELMMLGRYKMSSWLSSSIGPYNITVIGVSMGGSTELEVDPDGKIKVNDVSLDLKFKDFSIDFENLGFFGNIIQAILNSLITTIFDSAKPMIQSQINNRLQQQVNEQMRSLKVVMYDSIAPLDKILIDARNNIRNDGYEPLPLPEFYLPIFGAEEDHEYSNPLDSNVLALKEGLFSGLSTIYRADNMTIAYDDTIKAITAVVNLALRKVAVKYNWELKAGWYERSGTINLKIDGVTVGVTLMQPVNIQKPTFIKNLSVKLGNIQVNSKGAGALDYLTEFAVNAGLNGLRHGITAATQEVVRMVLNEKLKEIDLEPLIMEQIKSLNKKEEEDEKEKEED